MIRVVFIGAVGRSGTTLLERTLATSPHAVALGEMVHIWDRSVLSDELCGCGQAFSECPFWIAVGDAALGGWERFDLEQIRLDRGLVDRNRNIPLLIAPRLARPRFREAHDRLVTALGLLYEGIHEVVGTAGPSGTLLIDSSKHPSYLFLLRRVAAIDVRLLHVVRDPRGVTHSWSKEVARPESGTRMERLGTTRACLRWTAHNLLFRFARILGVPSVVMPYGLFTTDPSAVADAMNSLVPTEAPWRDKLAITNNSISLGVDHTVSGNPVRFTSGVITVRPDDEWRISMPKVSRRVVSIVTTPLRQWWAR